MAEGKPIRVLLVDDHAVVRSGLAAFLLAYEDLLLVGEAGGGEEAVRLCGELAPDVVLMDLVMPGMDGVAATRAIRERYPQIQVIALTSFKEKGLVQGVLEAGAMGYLLKNIPADELAEAIRAAQAGRSTVADEAVQTLLLAEKLERSARAMIDAPADGSTLPTLLGEHVPGMFPRSQIEMRIFPDRILLRNPAEWPGPVDTVWEWLRTASEIHVAAPGVPLPWEDEPATGLTTIAAPILGVGRNQPIGGIYIVMPEDAGTGADLLPAVQALAGQIASAVNRAETYAQALARQRVEQELAMAWEIQSSFLPDELPDLPGWQLAAALHPARQTSGDYYDLIPLPRGQWGIVIADVAGKGLGAALYMALSRTLIRTSAGTYAAQPAQALSAANERILTDTRSDMFVTVFYGVLDPSSGRLSYCNAGHNPPLLLPAQEDRTVQPLRRTGPPLGIEDLTWQQDTVQLAPGDLLVLYTDGITEAEDEQRAAFGQERLEQVLGANQGRSAQDVQEALIAEVQRFVGGALQADDITTIVLLREV